eukprot:g11251.t1
MVRVMVRLIKTKNCFVNLPPHVARGVAGASEGAVILRLSWEAPASTPASPSWAFVSWNGGISDAESGAIEVPLALARVIGLAVALDSDAYLSVRAETAGYVPTASRVCLEPLSTNDWEILEANAEHLEGQMLTQVCVAYTGQVMPIWVHNTSLIALHVVSVETPGGGGGGGGGAVGAPCVRLTADTEVAVTPKPRQRRRMREGERRHPWFRSSGLLRCAPPPPGWEPGGAVGGGGGRPFVLVHPTTLAGIDGWNSSPRSRAPWSPPARRLHANHTAGLVAPAPTHPPPAEALAVLWRDQPSSGEANGGGGGGGEGGGGGGGVTVADGPGDYGAFDGRSIGGAGSAAGVGGRGGVLFPRAGKRGVVVILREDARVPPGHVAVAAGQGGARLRERAGLAALRRAARVRVLSSAENAVALPRLVIRRIVPRNGPHGKSALASRAVSNPSAAASESAAAAFREALGHALSSALRGEGPLPGADSHSGGVTDGNDGSSSRNACDGAGMGVRGSSLGGRGGPGTGEGAGGDFYPLLQSEEQQQQRHRHQPEEQQHQHQHQHQHQQLPLARSPSRSGLRQLASPFAPLVLDHGCVVSLPHLSLPPTHHATPPQTNPCYRNGNPGRSAPGLVVDEFMVELSSETKSAAIPGFPPPPPPPPPTAAAGPSEGRTVSGTAVAAAAAAAAAAALEYTVLACQEDVDRAVAGAAVGGDVPAAEVYGTVAAAEEDRGAVGDGGLLGGVEEQMRAVSNLLAPVLVRSVAAARVRLGVAVAMGGVVVHGASGAGKTALALATARRLRESYLSLAGTEVVSCRDLQGRKMSDVLGALEEAFSSASRHAPSLVVLDDLDKIAPVEGDDGAGAFNAQSARIAERLEDLLMEVAGEAAAVAVLATTASVAALHPRLSRSGFLDAQVEIPPPRPAARASMLQSLVRGLGGSALVAEPGRRRHLCGQEEEQAPMQEDGVGEEKGEEEDDEEDGGIDWDYLSFKTEGCQARDLARLAKRALLHSALRRMKEAETQIATTTAAAEASRDHRQLLTQHPATTTTSLPQETAVMAPDGGNLSVTPRQGDGGAKDPARIACRGNHDKRLGVCVRNIGTPGNGAITGAPPPISGGSGACNTIATTTATTSSLSREVLCSSEEAPHEQGVVGGAGAGIEMEDLEAALDGFSAESLRGAGLFRSSVEWGDVGGLRGVRAELREILELPVKYGRLFEATPTRLPTGALLYGPPGCGKTLLAGAVAAECGLNFISVKGPEVLDKYIGASEQAVRSLFARGASAAPCVLFFDEFEAVAPRRGNDNTGVTDRVVNQLLTFLDGVEGRDGVYVLGATSRPDLIDSALLRPGRLDRQLYCGFPDEAEREDILRAVCRKTPMSEEAREVALAKVARSPKAEAFTGADLQAIVDTAQLAAIHSYLEALKPGAEGSKRIGEEAAGGRDEGDQDAGDSDSSGPSMGLLLGSNLQLDDENSTSAGTVARKSGQKWAKASVANGIVVETGSGHSNNCPTDAAGSSSLGYDLSSEPCNGEIGPTPSSGAVFGSDGNVNRSGGGGNRAGGEAGKRGGVEVSADNVWEAFLATRPSLSSEDRARYDSAYRKFRGGSRPADFNPISSVDDGTLRTALK